MMEQYLIAIDLDGTLFHTVTDYDKYSTEVLKKLSKDHKIVIATGRPFRSSKPYYDLLDLDTPIINYNGCLTFNPKDKSFPKKMHTISRCDLLNFIDLCSDYILNIFCEIEDDIYVDHITPDMVYYLHRDGGVIHEGNLKDILPSDPHGAMVFIKPNTSSIVSDIVNKNFNGKLKFRSWEVRDFEFCELYDPYVTKASYLGEIASYYNIDSNHIIALGDGENDSEMFSYAKYKVAMKNAKESLKKKANYITLSIEDSGVGKFLEYFFKEK